MIDDPAMHRLFNRMHICMKCNARIRADAEKIKVGKVKCRKCGYSGLRPKKRLRKGKSK